jgi:hypothetical protein
MIPEKLDKYTKWVANWRSSKPSFSYSHFDMWQYSSEGIVSGVRIDQNYAYIDFPHLIQSNGYNGYEKQAQAKKTVAELAKEVIDGKWGAGEERKNRLTNAGYDYYKVQVKVNEILKAKKSIDEIAREVIVGKWGVGSARKRALTQAGYDYEKVQARVNELLRK